MRRIRRVFGIRWSSIGRRAGARRPCAPAEVAEPDGVPLPVERTGWSRVTVDFGPLEHPEYARFVITSWGNSLDLRDVQAPPDSAGTTFEVPDGNGGWGEALVAGKSSGDVVTDTIEPLPFHGMDRYPYDPADGPYRDDPDYREYLDTWNTRRIELPGAAPGAPRSRGLRRRP